jgi:TM2 domain-containing membrane protein YozV
MNPILTGGVAIGVLCSAWMLIVGLTGWYKDPAVNAYFVPVVTAIEVGCLIWCLRRTAAQGRTYSGQVVAGTQAAIVAGVIIVCASLLFTTVLFPLNQGEAEAAYRHTLQLQGKSEAEIATAVAAAAPQTPMSQAMAGFMGTFMTGVVASAILGIWIRAKTPPAA